MTLDLQFKLKSNPMCLKYLRENSQWYIILNRDPEMFNTFIEEMKTAYKLRPSDKINKALSTFEMVTAIISSLNS